MRRRVAVAVVIALVIAWSPLLRPLAQGAIVVAAVYGPTLAGSEPASAVTPAPRVNDTEERFDGVAMRVTWWRPGWGERHPGMLVVNGATPAGNDDPVTRRLGDALARAGYLAMLPEFPFLKVGRLESNVTRQIDAAFALLRSVADVAGERASAFGSSVGAGVMLAAAGREPAIGRADALVVLGAYYDLDSYLASVVSGAQVRDGALVPWPPSDEVRDRLPRAALDGMDGPGDRAALQDALGAGGYAAVRDRLAALPPGARATLEALSPRTSWSRIRAPIFWLHDPKDSFEPIAEAEAARMAPHAAPFTLAAPGLVSHAAPVAGPVGDLFALLGFAVSAVRATD